jgi:hypothetical protein
MRFALTEEQTDLVATVHTLIAKRAASMDLRAAITTSEGYDTTLWQTLADQIGVTALAVPEAYGGVGCSYIEAHLVLEELGATLTPSPFVGTLLAAQVLTAAATPVAGELLERIAGGASAAVMTEGSDLVIDAAGAEILLFLCGDQVHAVEPVTVTPTPALDPTWRFATVTVDDAAGDPVGTVDPAYVTTVGATMMTALQAGAAERGLSLAGLVSRERRGRHVLARRTARGSEIVALYEDG